MEYERSRTLMAVDNDRDLRRELDLKSKSILRIMTAVLGRYSKRSTRA